MIINLSKNNFLKNNERTYIILYSPIRHLWNIS